jgi:hypothetical protein
LNRDESCKHRKMTAAALVGDTTQWLYDQVHAVNPKAQVLVWSDMFDPNHNAVKKYFLVDGSLENTWKYLPKDMEIMCWYFFRRKESLDFFSSHGFKTFASADPTPPLSRIPRDGWRLWTPRPVRRESCTQPGRRLQVSGAVWRSGLKAPFAIRLF